MVTDSSQRQPTDLELIERARQGDGLAFHGLVDRYADYLYSLAVSLSGNVSDAEDIVQETFTGAFRGLAAFQGRASFKTWLTHILIRQRARHLRSTRKGGATILPLDAAAAAYLAAPSPHGASDVRIDMAAAIGSLSPEHQEVIALREMQGLAYEAIAEVLDIPRGTVESRLFRARRELQDRLKGYLE